MSSMLNFGVDLALWGESAAAMFANCGLLEHQFPAVRASNVGFWGRRMGVGVGAPGRKDGVDQVAGNCDGQEHDSEQNREDVQNDEDRVPHSVWLLVLLAGRLPVSGLDHAVGHRFAHCLDH